MPLSMPMKLGGRNVASTIPTSETEGERRGAALLCDSETDLDPDLWIGPLGRLRISFCLL